MLKLLFAKFYNLHTTRYWLLFVMHEMRGAASEELRRLAQATVLYQIIQLLYFVPNF